MPELRSFNGGRYLGTHVRASMASLVLFSLVIGFLVLPPSVSPFTTAAAAADPVPGVVVNKYFNSGSTADIVELLVVQNNLDLRGMILKDFSSSMANDGGGKFTFTTNPLWASVPSGTLIVLRNNNTAADVNAGGGDFNLDVGLANTSYFTNSGGTFDIATVEMVMIKSAGSGAAGVTGSIHALAGGTAGAQFTAAPTPKLRATGQSGTNQFVYANNGTQSIADFNGTDATGAATGLAFGSGNNANNTAFINSLRDGGGIPTPTAPSGSGSATPNSVSSGGSTLLTVSVTAGTNPPSTGLTVMGDLTAIGGGGTQAFFDDGTNGDAAANDRTFSFRTNIPAGTSAGTKSIPATVSDAEGRSGTAFITVTVTAPTPTPDPVNHIVISQVYGGGGNSGAAYQNDYVELFNPDTKEHDLSGWTVQYASATGTLWQVQPIGGKMQPGEYYLVKLATNGTAGAAVPAGNVEGTLNLSGSNGKVALSRVGDAFEGCPTDDPALVDLVGYGSANCREGSTSAPVLSNATAGVRKFEGYLDTNVNGNDFAATTPNPRRTTPIIELPPSVLTSDPRTNATTAPRDANITVTFTEPVTVEDGWVNINCAVSGAHDSFTLAPGGTNAWIIIPNVTFVPGEQCTVNVVKEFVRDVDTDDATPADDVLTKNYSAAFTIATGAAPAYSADVHLTMGNPSDAVADPVSSPNNYLMVKPEFSLSYNRDKGTPNWVSWHLADEWVGSLARVDTFRADPAVPADWYRVTGVDYLGSGFDRGHMVPNADRDPATSIPINQATFLMTNMIPQAPDNNQGPWADMENDLRALLPGNELYIVSGPAGVSGTIANGRVAVPVSTWKVALVIPKDSGDDAARVGCASRTIAVNMPNVQGIRSVDWTNYLTTVDAIEQMTGFNLFSNLPAEIQACVEAGVNGVNPPGTADQSVATTEDTPVAFTLIALNSTPDPLTVEVVNPPAGELSCAGVNCTYTPVADYNGVDDFSYRVASGNKTSNTSTVTINVAAVNDAPTLDPIAARTVDFGETVTFTATASDVDEPGAFVFSLTGNIPAGASIDPANGQFTWTPTAAQAGRIHVFGVRVTDSGGLYMDRTVTIAVAYPWSGLTGKLSAGGDSYRIGSTIPVTFALTGAAAGITDATARLYLAPMEGGVPGAEFEATASGDSNSGNLFRYDADAGHYIYNLDTRGLRAGIYRLRVDLGDGVVRTVPVTLR